MSISESEPLEYFLYAIKSPITADRYKGRLTNTKSYVLFYRPKVGRDAGKLRRLTIGTAAEWSLADARDEAREWKRRIEKGEDPKDVMARQHTEALDRAENTFGKITSDFIRKHASLPGALGQEPDPGSILAPSQAPVGLDDSQGVTESRLAVRGSCTYPPGRDARLRPSERFLESVCGCAVERVGRHGEGRLVGRDMAAKGCSSLGGRTAVRLP